MKRALVLIDIQNDYFPGGKMELAGMDAAAKQASHVLQLFRQRQWPVIHIRHVADNPKATFFLPETEGAHIHPIVAPRDAEPVIEKHLPNSFAGTSLQRQLKDLGIEEIVFCGAMSHMCVDSTVRAAFDAGFQCRVVSDACATRSLQFGDAVVEASQVHAAFMAALSAVFASVVTTGELENLIA